MIRFIVIAYKARDGKKERLYTKQLSADVDIEKYARELSITEDFVEVYDIELNIWNKYSWGTGTIGNYEY